MPPRIPSTSEVKRESRAVQADTRRLASFWCITLRIRPLKIGLATLAIAIFLWGFGYKLSRYQIHPNAFSRVSAAKLWDDSRNARVVADVLRKANTHSQPVVDALATTAETQASLPYAGRGELAPLPLPSQQAFISSLPSRSPPAPRGFLV